MAGNPAWCIDGAVAWKQAGLNPPECVRSATEEYFSEQDTTQRWLDECTEDGGEHAFTRTAELFASWKVWAEARNLRAGTEQALSETLRNRRLVKKRCPKTDRMGFRIDLKG